jgi:uncharacterized damage-inducible protein DinB
MTAPEPSVANLYDGWEDYQISLVRAVAPLAPEQLAWRPAPQLRSAGELVAHIIRGRIQWFHHYLGVGGPQFAGWLESWEAEAAPERQPAGLIRALEATWRMIADALDGWTIADLAQVCPILPYKGKEYAVTRQWVIWHVIAHDLHHGGELALMLGMQGVSLPDLGGEGGHLSERAPLAEPRP